MGMKEWNVYLSGEIHTDWRERIIEGSKEKGLRINFASPVTDHDAFHDDSTGLRGRRRVGGGGSAARQQRGQDGHDEPGAAAHCECLSGVQ